MEKLILLMQEINSKREDFKSLEKEIMKMDDEAFDIKTNLSENHIVKYNGEISKSWSFYAGGLDIFLHDLNIKCNLNDVELISKKEIYQEDNVVYLSDYRKLRAA